MTKSLRAALIVLLILVGAVGCVRPDKSPSPFEGLQRNTPKTTAVPQGIQDGPDFEIIPDSELVYGPALADFPLSEFVSAHLPALNVYSEVVDEVEMSGTEILEKISLDYSVNPRLLLSMLRNRAVEGSFNLDNPFVADAASYQGLFRQLSWAANELNRGYYTRRVDALNRITMADGTQVDLSGQISAGTAAVQYVYGLMLGYSDWKLVVGPLGLYADYLGWFGDPQDRAVDPLLPAALSQPELYLPYAEDEAWYFTSGPHSAWGNGAAWAALDFAPEKPNEDAWGCYESQTWVRAVGNGAVVRISDGLVVQELDGDGFEGSGWTILYMHVAEQDRVQLGDMLKAGDVIGHPSCEGGPATGTHLHIARRYNGEWIPADQDIPFVMNGWVSAGFGVEYDGSLARDAKEIEASGFPTDDNKILH